MSELVDWLRHREERKMTVKDEEEEQDEPRMKDRK